MEEWTDTATAAGITDTLDVKNVGRWMMEVDSSSSAGLRSGKAFAVAETLTPSPRREWSSIALTRWPPRRRLHKRIKVICASSAAMYRRDLEFVFEQMTLSK